MRDLPSTIFAGCFMLAMAVFLPLVIACILVSRAFHTIWEKR